MSMIKAVVGAGALAVSALSMAWGDAKSSDSPFPPTAVRRGPYEARSPVEKYCDYFLPGVRFTSENLIGRETYIGSVLVKQEVYRAGKKNGLWREWYTNGQIKLEAPWVDDVMHGLFRHWDEKGNLVGQYRMNAGSGVERVYNSSGQLVEEVTVVDGLKHGWAMTLSTQEGALSLNRFAVGHVRGLGYRFSHPGDGLQELSWFDDSVRNGLIVHFSRTGQAVIKEWQLENKWVSEGDYARAAQADTNLPTYFADAQQYTNLVEREARELALKYLSMPRVQIPLDPDTEDSAVDSGR